MIVKKAHQQKADIIIMGARRRTIATAILLGSIAEKLIQLNENIPLMLIKRKGGPLRFIDWFIKEGCN